LVNSPHLQPAFEVDDALRKFSGELEHTCGFDTIQTVEDLDMVMSTIQHRVLPSLKLWEFFVIDVDSNVQRFRQLFQKGIADYDVSYSFSP